VKAGEIEEDRGTGNRQARAALIKRSTLARLEAALNLVDHVNAALAANQAVVAVATTQRFQRVTDFHGTILMR
jgi:hypothetical protein